VEFHRGNIRRKLGLKRGDQQLGAALSTLLPGRRTAGATGAEAAPGTDELRASPGSGHGAYDG
jgi:hypothetical protein